LTATRLIKAQFPTIQIIILTTSAEDEDLFASIQSGACGYLLKSIRAAEFIEALRGLEEGAPPFSPGLAARLLKEFARLSGRAVTPTTEVEAKPCEPQPGTEGPTGANGLSDRQAGVLRLVASGLTYKEVGRELAISERTVRYHMAEIMDKLHLEHRSQVLAYAGALGLGKTTA
jgi:two-component system NarL family response regulator